MHVRGVILFYDWIECLQLSIMFQSIVITQHIPRHDVGVCGMVSHW